MGVMPTDWRDMRTTNANTSLPLFGTGLTKRGTVVEWEEPDRQFDHTWANGVLQASPYAKHSIFGGAQMLEQKNRHDNPKSRGWLMWTQSSAVYAPESHGPKSGFYFDLMFGLPCTQTELPCTQTGLPCTQTELPCTQTGLLHTQTELLQTQTELPCTQTELLQTQTGLPCTQTELLQTQTELLHTQTGLPCTQTELPCTQTMEDGSQKRSLTIWRNVSIKDVLLEGVAVPDVRDPDRKLGRDYIRIGISRSFIVPILDQVAKLPGMGDIFNKFNWTDTHGWVFASFGIKGVIAVYTYNDTHSLRKIPDIMKRIKPSFSAKGLATIGLFVVQTWHGHENEHAYGRMLAFHQGLLIP